MKPISYPFVPKSNRYLKPGQFWAIPLGKKRYGCGRVIDLPHERYTGSAKSFLAGLMEWNGKQPPISKDIAGSKLLTCGEVHIKTILTTGGKILGMRPLSTDGITVPYFCSQSSRGGCRLLRGLRTIRAITDAEFRKYPVMSTWGYGVIKKMALKLVTDPTGLKQRLLEELSDKTDLPPYPRIGR